MKRLVVSIKAWLVIFPFTLFGCAVSTSSHHSSDKVNTTAIICYDRGIEHYIKGQTSEAISHFSRAIELDPDSNVLYQMRSTAYELIGKKEFIQEDNINVLELDSESAIAYSSRAISSMKNGDYDQAMDDYNSAIEIAPMNGDIYFFRAVLFYTLEEYEQAWDDVHEAKRLGARVEPIFLKMLRSASRRKELKN